MNDTENLKIFWKEIGEGIDTDLDETDNSGEYKSSISEISKPESHRVRQREEKKEES